MKSIIAVLILLLVTVACDATVSRVVTDEEIPENLISLYERLTSKTVLREPSLLRSCALITLDIRHEVTRATAASLIADALQKQAGIVVTDVGDVHATASFNPKLPLEPLENIVRQIVGDLGLVLQVKKGDQENAPEISGVLDQESLERLTDYFSAMKASDISPSRSGITVVTPDEYRVVREIYKTPTRMSPNQENDLRKRILEQRNRRIQEREQRRIGQPVEEGNAF